MPILSKFYKGFLLEENHKNMLLKHLRYLENLSIDFLIYFLTEDIKLCDWNWIINPFDSNNS